MSEPLAVGAAAPDFTLSSHLGDRVTLSTLLAQGQNVVVFFYPFDWTPV